MKPIRIVVVDDHHLFRAGLVSLLAEMPEFEVVGDASNGSDAIEIVRSHKPDVVLVDVNMPGMDGIEVVEELKRKDKCAIIMLTISTKDEDLFNAINAGADGYLLKNAGPEDLRKAILNVSEGKSSLSPEVTRQVLTFITNSQGYIPNFGLSKREMEILTLLSLGKTTAYISDTLFISRNTVKTHVRHILEKLEASNRAEAVRKAIHLGLIKAD